jgi:hypothetical protein
LDSLLITHPQHCCRIPIASLLFESNPKEPYHHAFTGELSRKRKNYSGKRGGYRKFDEASSRMRESLIKSCVERVIDHAASNGRRCRLCFVKELVDELNQRAPLLKITRDDINNKVRIIKGQHEEEERREVLPTIPFHIIHDPSLSTNSDLSVSVSSNEQNPLDILAS